MKTEVSYERCSAPELNEDGVKLSVLIVFEMSGVT